MKTGDLVALLILACIGIFALVYLPGCASRPSEKRMQACCHRYILNLRGKLADCEKKCLKAGGNWREIR